MFVINLYINLIYGFAYQRSWVLVLILCIINI